MNVDEPGIIMSGCDAFLRDHAREQGWPKQLAEFLKTFPKEFGIDE